MKRANFPGRKTLRRIRAGYGTPNEVAEAARHLTRTKGGNALSQHSREKGQKLPRERHDEHADEFRELVKGSEVAQ